MDAIDKMIAALAEEAAQEQTQVAQETREKIARQSAQELQQQQEAIQKRAAQAQKQLEKKVHQEIKRAENQYEQARLAKLNAYLDQLFTQAIQEMTAWPKEQVQQFAAGILPTLPIQSDAVFRVAEGQGDALNPQWLAQCNESLPYNLVLGEPLAEPGFLIDDHGVQYNFTYRLLVADYQQAHSSRWRQLFEKGA